jgi:hypothetical protein
MAALPVPKAPRTSIRAMGHPIAQVKLASRDRGLTHDHSGRLIPRAFREESIAPPANIMGLQATYPVGSVMKTPTC